MMVDNIMLWIEKNLLGWFTILMIVVVIGAVIGTVIIIPYHLFRESQKETFSLRKGEWGCTASHRENMTTYVMAGKVMVPIHNPTTVCDQWTKGP